MIMTTKRPGKVRTTTYLSPENDSRNIVYGQVLPTSEEAAGQTSPLQTQSQNTKTQEGAGTSTNPSAGSYPPNPSPMQGPGDRQDRPLAMPKLQPDPNPWSAQVTNSDAV